MTTAASCPRGITALVLTTIGDLLPQRPQIRGPKSYEICAPEAYFTGSGEARSWKSGKFTEQEILGFYSMIRV